LLVTHVVAAIIKDELGRVLLTRRMPGTHLAGLWEFPGGKVESTESEFEALKRELDEELNIVITEAQPFSEIRHEYPDKTIQLNIWTVNAFNGVTIPAEGQEMKWVPIKDLLLEDMPAADRATIVRLMCDCRYVITGSFTNTGDYCQQLEKVLKKGYRLIQLRVKGLPEAEYIQLAMQCKKLTEKYAALLFVNASIRVFEACKADGLHLDSKSKSLLKKRPIANHYLLSVSTHSATEIAHAEKISADIILLSPVKATASHPDTKPLGWPLFSALRKASSATFYALGGMKNSDIEDAKKNGAHGVAAIGSFWGSGACDK